MTTAAPLLNTPNTPEDWDAWSFQLSQNLSDISDAIRVQKNVVVAGVQVYPIPAVDLQLWLLRVSDIIGQICDVLGIQSSDIENVELNDERERQTWVFQIFTQVNQARIILKI